MTAPADPRKLADIAGAHPDVDALVERTARGLRAARELLNALPLTDGASRRAIDREFIGLTLIPDGLMALDGLRALARLAQSATERSAELSRDAAEAKRERDAAKLVPPVIRQTLEKALRLDMTQPPVTHSELRAAIDLLPESPSFYSSVAGMEQLAAAEAERDRLARRVEELAEALRKYGLHLPACTTLKPPGLGRDPAITGQDCDCDFAAVLAASTGPEGTTE